MFRIDWDNWALGDLTAQWSEADSQLREDITDTAHQIDLLLSRAPEKAGESREPGTRVLIIHPLSITFHVNVRTKSVLISGVRASKRRRR